jgi:hypothetical protein
MRSAFPLSTSDLIALQQQQQMNSGDSGSKVRRQKSNKETTTAFSSLPHDGATPGGARPSPVVHSGKTRRPQNRSQSTDPREKSRFRPLSMFHPFANSGSGGGGGSGWFNPGYVWREAGPELTGGYNKTEAARQQQQWYLQERHGGGGSNMLHSMPAMLSSGSLAPVDSNSQLSRSDRSRSSFGMILKDRFQKNPNMYFPDTSRTPSRTPPEDKKKDRKKTGVSQDDLSDTDTLIRNMSEGSFDKDSSSISGGGRSFDSTKSDRSSGKSSSLSHDSMDGTPKMIRRRQPESITTPKAPSTTAVHLASNPSVILNKKTIRNYTPMESSALLRQFEETRHTTLERRGRRSKTNLEPSSAEPPEEGEEELESPIQRKSSVDRLIEDFHRSLPPPPTAREEDEEAIETAAGSPFSDGDSILSGTEDRHKAVLPRGGGGDSVGSTLAAKKQPGSHHSGTVNSQASIWSVGSSVASFDYHTVASVDKGAAVRHQQHHLSHKQQQQQQSSLSKSNDRSNSSGGKKRGGSSTTVDLAAAAATGEPAGERVPPEGAAASDPSPRSSFVQRIEVRADLQRRSEALADKKSPTKTQQRKSGKEAAREEVADLLQPQETGVDELVMLKRLISEGRISGLNEKPPTFKPPTPPSKAASAAKKTKAPKSPAPKTPDVNKPSGGRTGTAAGGGSSGGATKAPEDRPRKARDAPPPPPAASHPIKAQPETSEIKFLSGRRIHSVENLQEDDHRQRRPEREGRREEKSEAVQRSTSMHLSRGKKVSSITNGTYLIDVMQAWYSCYG